MFFPFQGPSKKVVVIVGDNIRYCEAKGREYTLGQSFSFMDQCLKYKCECHSDGSWECLADRADNTCEGDRDRQPTPDRSRTRTQRSCNVRGKEYSLGNRFSFMEGCIKYNCLCYYNGSWDCPADKAVNTCERDRTRTENVRTCSLYGKEYTAGRPFSFMDGCFRYNCECYYNGSWKCPADKSENTCRDRQPTPDRERSECF